VQYSASAVPVLQISLSSDYLNESQLYDYGIYRLRQMIAPIHGVTLPPALIVPASAITFNQDGMQVAVVEDGVAHLHKIAITADYGTEAEVNAGVRNGDKVILQPPVNLADGSKVQIIPEPPAATP